MIRRWGASSHVIPWGALPLFFSDQPYVYGGNNPLINVDPSGQFMADLAPVQAHAIMHATAKRAAHVVVTRGCMKRNAHPTCKQIDDAKASAQAAADTLGRWLSFLSPNGGGLLATLLSRVKGIQDFFKSVGKFLFGGLADAMGLVAAGFIALIGTVMLNLWAVQNILWFESSQPDSYWESDARILAFKGKAAGSLLFFNAVAALFGLALVAFASNPVSLPVAVGIGIVFGVIVSLVTSYVYFLDQIDAQRRILGYTR